MTCRTEWAAIRGEEKKGWRSCRRRGGCALTREEGSLRIRQLPHQANSRRWSNGRIGGHRNFQGADGGTVGHAPREPTETPDSDPGERDADYKVQCLDRQEGQVAEIRHMVEDITKGGVARSDSGSTLYFAGNMDRHRLTLVWGGPREKTVGLARPCAADYKLQVREMMDADPWTNWAQAASCASELLPSSRRVRARCEAAHAQDPPVFCGGQHSSGGQAHLVLLLEKPRRKKRAGHASLVKKVVKEVSEDQVDRIDIEYTLGTVWMEESRIASAVHPRGTDPYVRAEPTPCRTTPDDARRA